MVLMVVLEVVVLNSVKRRKKNVVKVLRAMMIVSYFYNKFELNSMEQ